VPDDPPLDTPLLVAVSCRSVHVPFASLSSKPPSADVEKHDEPSKPIALVVFDPNDTRGHTSTDGLELPTLDVWYGARSHRSKGSTAVTDDADIDDGSVK